MISNKSVALVLLGAVLVIRGAWHLAIAFLIIVARFLVIIAQSITNIVMEVYHAIIRDNKS